MLNLFYLIAGLAILTVGGEALIRGALGLSKKFGISPVLVGLVVVGFGTSAPEMVVSVSAAMNDQSDLAIGNVIGSNIGNILFILGLCAIISPLVVTPAVLQRDVYFALGACLLFSILVAFDDQLSLISGIIFLAGLAVYLGIAYTSETKKFKQQTSVLVAESEEVEKIPSSFGLMLLALAGGFALLIWGSMLLIDGAVGIAQYFGLSEAVIGLTIVAIGTSLPELSVSLIAAIRKHNDVAIANIVGSNIFNIFGILGISALVSPLQVAERIFEFDQWVLIFTTLILLIFLYTGRRLSRLEGAVLLAGYVAYLTYSYSLLAG